MLNIRKSVVDNGIFWVEIPQADVRILCGSPEDSVKHLIRRGFINSIEENEVVYETGPNAILLSDTATQNGRFSNLAEFPVLQMLYRQGMIIPGHPGNRGVKPMLIGSEVQTRAQVDYIFRGNYGLISEEELISAGASPSEAKDLMRLKLKFAFGAIKSPREILDICVVEDDIAHVRNTVYIQRVESNVFEISYAGETVEVDLNLAPGTRYEPPYNLGFHALEREYFTVIHSGDGDGWDVNRPTMSSIVMYQGRIYLVDAGPNIENTLKSLGIGIPEVEGLFLTHAHDDHFCGITTLMRTEKPIKFLSTTLVRASALKKLSALMSMDESEFDHFFEFVDLAQGEWNPVRGLEVKPVFSPHPVENTCLLFRAMDSEGYKTYAHLADTTSYKVLQSFVTEDDDAPGISQEMFDRVKETYEETASIKKIDIGGGMIHGEADDFINDRSPKIVLAHRASPLTEKERNIGEGAPFGTLDNLIVGSQEYIYQNTARHLRLYFPKLESHNLQSLMNGKVVQFNPETFLVKEGTICEAPILLISGQVERLANDGSQPAQLSAGYIIGQDSFLNQEPLNTTYRSTSFVTAIYLPRAPFANLFDQGYLHLGDPALLPMRLFMERNHIFNDNISRHTLAGLVSEASELKVSNGESLNWDRGDNLYLIRSGCLKLVVNGREQGIAEAGDCVGETFILFGVRPVYQAVADGDVDVLCLSTDQLSAIPVVRWKLLNIYKRRIHDLVIHTDQLGHTFEWGDDYLLDIKEMDSQHKNLFHLADKVMENLNLGADGQEAQVQALSDLIEASEKHFENEETFLSGIHYPQLDHHGGLHVRLITDIETIRTRILGGERISHAEFRSFFMSWITFHILGEDFRYARYQKSMMNFSI
ncbi:hemerythrin domain-containing protein [Magnetovibrio sp. PR-2]|uniref:hemerythrin domain-containing protein n=1 Tax=Magnetovibrio sp. PR-2 TaxID=3120356 RepID=UPI002FCE0388